jgi:hypothetical protein
MSELPQLQARGRQAAEDRSSCSALQAGGRPFEPGIAHHREAASEADPQAWQHREDCLRCAASRPSALPEAATVFKADIR